MQFGIMKIIFEPQKRHFALPASYSIIPLERRSPLTLCEKKKQKTENRKQKHKQEQKKGKGWNFNLTFMDSLF
jgi:hypothetical protein